MFINTLTPLLPGSGPRQVFGAAGLRGQLRGPAAAGGAPALFSSPHSPRTLPATCRVGHTPTTRAQRPQPFLPHPTPPLKATPQPRAGCPVSQGPHQPLSRGHSHRTHCPSPRGKTTANKCWDFFPLQNVFFSRHSLFFPLSFYSKHCKYRNISLYNRTVYSGGRAGTHTAGPATPAPESRGAPGPCRRPPAFALPRPVMAAKRRTKQSSQKATQGQAATPPTSSI